MNNKLVISPYDERWPEDFKTEQSLLLTAFENESVQIEHIGSTAVPKLSAKPIIDIMAGVQSLAYAESLIAGLNVLGYEYVSKFETQLPDRRYFRTPNRHLHCVKLGSPFWIDQLLFRDFLRNNPEVAEDYSALKKSLAEKHSRNHRAYTKGKSDFISSVLRRARPH